MVKTRALPTVVQLPLCAPLPAALQVLPPLRSVNDQSPKSASLAAPARSPLNANWMDHPTALKASCP